MSSNKAANELQTLQERYQEVYEFLTSLLEDYNRQEEEIRYLSGFLSYKNLEEEYVYFRRNAHEEYEEDRPFPRLTL